MREIISEARLRDEISARMNAELRFGAGTFWARPVRCKESTAARIGITLYNPAAVAAGCVELWEHIRPALEGRYDLGD